MNVIVELTAAVAGGGVPLPSVHAVAIGGALSVPPQRNTFPKDIEAGAGQDRIGFNVGSY